MPATLPEALKSLVAAGAAVDGDRDVSAWETGARRDAGQAAGVLRPATTDELAAVVGWCVRHGLAFVPQSANTGLVGGSVPDASGEQLVLGLDRLNRWIEVDAANRSVRVGAGIRLSELNARLEEHGLWFPIDLGADPLVGGMVATNTGGARFLRHGDVRANTLGLTAVVPDAEASVLRLGRALRKDNTGPDWKHLFIGTSGAFGIVAEATLALAPVPAARATALVVPADEASVPGLAQALETRLGQDLSAFEFLSGNAMRHAMAHAPSIRNPFAADAVPELALLVEIARSRSPAADEATLDAVLERTLGELWECGDAPLADAVFAPPEVLWSLRHGLSEGVKQAGRLFAFDLAFERPAVFAFRESMRTRLARDWPEIEVCDFGHVADGGLHFNLVCHDAARAAEPGYEPALRDAVVAHAVEDFGASFSGEHGVGRLNQRYYDRYTPDALKTLAERFGASLGIAATGGARFGHE